MKRFILSSAIISVFVVLSSCEQHDWEDTKLLHVDKAKKDGGHGDHAESHDHDHGDKSDAHGAGSEGH